MEDNLRKHILSQYINNSGMKQIFNPTVNTAAGEISDPDEFLKANGVEPVDWQIENI